MTKVRVFLKIDGETAAFEYDEDLYKNGISFPFPESQPPVVKMTTYYLVAETLPCSHLTACRWRVVIAENLEDAKFAALHSRTFQETCAHVGVLGDDGIECVATYYPPNLAEREGWHYFNP
jgi:hypothetical protein